MDRSRSAEHTERPGAHAWLRIAGKVKTRLATVSGVGTASALRKRRRLRTPWVYGDPWPTPDHPAVVCSDEVVALERDFRGIQEMRVDHCMFGAQTTKPPAPWSQK